MPAYNGLACAVVVVTLGSLSSAAGMPNPGVDDHSELGKIASLVESGQLEEAESTLKAIIKRDPQSSPAYRLLGLVYQKEEKYSQAENALERASSLSAGKDPETLFLLCQTEFALKNTRKALELAGEASFLAGDNPQGHYALGRLLRENSQSRNALQELERARALAPDNPSVATELILANLDLGRESQAEELLRSVLTSASYHDLLEAGARFGDASKFLFAVRVFERALELQPVSYDAQFNLAFAYYRQGAFEKALAMLDRMSSQPAQSQPDFYYLRGKIEAALHDGQAAGQEYLVALKLQPDNESLCSDAGLLFFRFENFWKALEIYEACARRLPDSVPVQTGLGLTYFRLGKYGDAAGTLKKVLTLRQDADAAREALAFLYYISGKLMEAKSLLEARLTAQGADYYTWYLHALVLLRLESQSHGDHTAALRSLDQSVRRNPQFAPAYFQRAKLWNESGQTSRALADLKAAARLDPDYAEPYYLLAQIDYKLGRMEEAQQARRNYTARQREREEKEQKQLVENRLLQALH
jgi:tetratricopeptide (TPR) repeat protein